MSVLIRQVPATLVLRAARTTLGALGDTVTVRPVATDSNNVEIRPLPFRLTWDATDRDVISLHSDASENPFALVIARANGNSTVQGEYNGVHGSIDFTVQPQAASLIVMPASLSLAAGTQTQLQVQLLDGSGAPLSTSVVTWASSNESIVTVSADGALHAQANGTATITAESGTLRKDVIVEVTTAADVVSIAATPDSGRIVVGRTTQLRAITRNASGVIVEGAAVTWQSLDQAIATVDGAGSVVAVSAGTARLIAASGTASDTITITVRLADTRPNIIVVLTDDQSAESWPYMTHTNAAVTSQGIRLPNFFVNTALCCPSRTTLLRGQYSGNHQVVNNAAPLGGYSRVYSLGLESSTIATWLHDAGYQTAIMGKYLNQYPDGASANYIPPGWNEWDVITQTNDDDTGRGWGPYYGYVLNENGTLHTYGFREQDYQTDVLGAKALSYTRRMADEGSAFFLLFTPTAPHLPAMAAPRHETWYQGLTYSSPSQNELDVSDKPSTIRDQPLLSADEISIYNEFYRERLRTLAAIDEFVGALVDSLRQDGVLDNTYIFVTSDNGFHLGEHRLPVGKGQPYEEDVRVEMMVRGPGIAAGTSNDALTSNVDLAPTFAEIAGVTAPAFVDGRSLLAQLRGAPSSRNAVRIERYGGGSGLRTRDYKYILRYGGEQELYDLRTDPYEMNNIATTADPALVARMSEWFGRLIKCAGAQCRAIEDELP